jgi:hypothetical protein
MQSRSNQEAVARMQAMPAIKSTSWPLIVALQLQQVALNLLCDMTRQMDRNMRHLLLEGAFDCVEQHGAFLIKSPNPTGT